MRKIFLSILFIFMSFAPCFAEPRLAIVQSSRIAPFEKAVHGLASSPLSAGVAKGGKSVHPIEIKYFVLSEQADSQAFADMLASDKPDVIAAVGASALEASVDAGVPVVYLLVPLPKKIINGKKNITGVLMELPPELQLECLLDAAPKLRRIGLAYRKSVYGEFVDRAEAYMDKRGFSLRAAPVDSAKQMPSALAGLADGLDAVWMLPDPKLISRESLEVMVMYSMKTKVPIITFSDKYLKRGAALSIGFDSVQLGEQAADLINEILNGRPVEDLPPQYPVSAQITVNKRMAEKLNLRINESAKVKIEYASWK